MTEYNYDYTTISVKRDTLFILKDVKRDIEESRGEFVSTDEAVRWLLEIAGYIYD